MISMAHDFRFLRNRWFSANFVAPSGYIGRPVMRAALHWESSFSTSNVLQGPINHQKKVYVFKSAQWRDMCHAPRPKTILKFHKFQFYIISGLWGIKQKVLVHWHQKKWFQWSETPDFGRNGDFPHILSRSRAIFDGLFREPKCIESLLLAPELSS